MIKLNAFFLINYKINNTKFTHVIVGFHIKYFAKLPSYFTGKLIKKKKNNVVLIHN